jgi:predicted ester cyclase
VAARVTYSGTHEGEFVGIPATGQQTQTSGVDFFRMQDGKQAEHWGGSEHGAWPSDLLTRRPGA